VSGSPGAVWCRVEVVGDLSYFWDWFVKEMDRQTGGRRRVRERNVVAN